MAAARPLMALGACLLACIACGQSQATQRVFHGRVVLGPYIEPEAYAAFAEGAYLEAHGDWAGAASAYRRARERGPDGPGIAARLGAVTCRTSLAAALEAFETSGIARDYAPAWAERARCLLSHHHAPRALDAARRAIRLDPSNADANLAIARIQREQGRPEAARAWLFAWVLSDPNAIAHRAALDEQARLLGDSSLGALVAALGQWHAADDDEPPTPVPAPTSAARAAIARGDAELAAQHAALALAANPSDADALVIAAFAAHLELDGHRLAEVLERARPRGVPRPDAAAWMAELLRTRVGDEAAESWLAEYRRVAAKAGTTPRGPRAQ